MLYSIISTEKCENEYDLNHTTKKSTKAKSSNRSNLDVIKISILRSSLIGKKS